MYMTRSGVSYLDTVDFDYFSRRCLSACWRRLSVRKLYVKVRCHTCRSIRHAVLSHPRAMGGLRCELFLYIALRRLCRNVGVRHSDEGDTLVSGELVGCLGELAGGCFAEALVKYMFERAIAECKRQWDYGFEKTQYLRGA